MRPPKVHEKVFLQKDLKKTKKTVGTETMTKNYLTDNTKLNGNRIAQTGNPTAVGQFIGVWLYR